MPAGDGAVADGDCGSGEYGCDGRQERKERAHCERGGIDGDERV